MHLFQCRSPNTAAVLIRGLGELEDKLRQRHMPSAMWTSIREGITAFCNKTKRPTRDLTEPMATAVEAQDRIGWDNFLKGRVAINWGFIMRDEYAGNASLRMRESRRRFMTTMIDGLWDIYDALWKHRCDLVHNNTDINALSVKEVDRRVNFLYAHKTTLFDSGDYDRFHLGLQHTLALPLPQKKAWIETLSHRQLATERARKRLINKIRPITMYFDQVDRDEESVD